MLDTHQQDLSYCPIWGTFLNRLSKPIETGLLIYSPRAGGFYKLEGIWADTAFRGQTIGQFRHATDREKANLSYWIFQQNLQAGLLTPDVETRKPHDTLMERRGEALITLARRVPTVDYDTAMARYIRQPTAQDRLLNFVGEFLRQKDLQEPSRALVEAGSACRNSDDYIELANKMHSSGWVHETDATFDPAYTSLTWDARYWFEQHTRVRGQGQQGFVAMWFDPIMDPVYEKGFKVAIQKAGYDPRRIDDDTDHSDKLDDRILAEIRISRFVVADFTNALVEIPQNVQISLDLPVIRQLVKSGNVPITQEGRNLKVESLARGGVYFEAGFASGLGIPVIYTCHAQAMAHRHFDTWSINHLVWKDVDDLARSLQARIEGQFGRGPAAG